MNRATFRAMEKKEKKDTVANVEFDYMDSEDTVDVENPIFRVEKGELAQVRTEVSLEPLRIDVEGLEAGFKAYSSVPKLNFDEVLPEHDEPEERTSESQTSQHKPDIKGAESLADSFTAVLDDTQSQLEKLQIQTVFGLVEPVWVTSGGDAAKKLLFLTNKQATDFDFENMGKLMSAMDIPEPKLVINLIGALDLNGASKAAELTVAP